MHPGLSITFGGQPAWSRVPQVSAPSYDVLLVAHAAVALLGFGAIAVAGLRARAGRQSGDPAADIALRRFFAPGRDLPARAIFLVPLLGMALLFGGDRADVSAAWPWIGLGLWVVAAGLASGMCWPAERRAQQALEHLDSADDDEERSLWSARFREACVRMERSVGSITMCFLAALAVMVLQPR